MRFDEFARIQRQLDEEIAQINREIRSSLFLAPMTPVTPEFAKDLFMKEQRRKVDRIYDDPPSKPEKPTKVSRIYGEVTSIVQQQEWAKQIYDRIDHQEPSSRKALAKNPPKQKATTEVQPCTADWDFSTIFESNHDHGHPDKTNYCAWTCGCGETYNWKARKNKDIITVEQATERAFAAFTVHKLAHGVDDQEELNRVLDECYPAPTNKKKIKLHISTKMMLISIFLIVVCVALAMLGTW